MSIYTIIICPHEYKYINLLKENAQNLILFVPLTLQHDFASYNTYLNKLNSDEYIIYGAHTQNIPLITILEDSFNEYSTEETKSTVNFNETETLKQEANNTEEIIITNTKSSTKEEALIKETPIAEGTLPIKDTLTLEEETALEDENIIIEEEPEINEEPLINKDSMIPQTGIEEYSNTIEYPDITDTLEITETDTEQKITNDSQAITNILEDLNEEDTIIDETVIQDGEDTQIDDIEVEPLYGVSEYQTEDIQIEEQQQFENPESDNREEEEKILQQVVKDVDKALYEKIDIENDISFDNAEVDELTEDDLNLIGDLNSDNSEENEIEITDLSEENPSVLPIYPGENLEDEESQKLDPGDRVSTPKYGEGVVEKMIKYGNKMLCSIEFPNIGRRLLDPAMSDITKLS